MNTMYLLIVTEILTDSYQSLKTSTTQRFQKTRNTELLRLT